MKKYDTYKDSGIEWIGEIPSHWEVKKFKYLFIEHSGNGFPQDMQGRSSGDIPFYKVSDLNSEDNYVEFSNNYVSFKDASEKGWNIIPQSSILTAKIGEALKKNHRKICKGKCIIDNNCLGIEPIKIDTKFSFYLLKATDFDWFTNPGAVPSVSMDKLRNHSFSIPPTSEQSLIADYLDRKTAEIDELIADKEKLIELYEEEKTAIINELVTGKIVWNGNAWVEPSEVKDSGVEWLGEIPEHWEVKRLKYVGESIMGIIYSPKEIVPKKNNSLLVLRASNIQNGKFSYNDSVYVETKVNEKQILRKNDILICSRSGSASLIGKNILIDERIAGQTFGAFMTVFRTNLARFVYFYFNSQIFRALTALFSTSTINQLTISTLNNFVIAIPPLSEQTTIVQHIESESARIDAKIANAKKLIDLLKEYRTALISEVVTGKMRVVD